MFNRRFLQYSDVVLEVAYQLIPISYHRWCSVAQGGGWFVLMYPKDMPIEDSIYRHIHTLFTFVAQITYNQSFSIVELQKTVLGMNERIAALEFSLYPSFRQYKSNF